MEVKLGACVPWTGGDRWRTASFRATVDRLSDHGRVYVGGLDQTRGRQFAHRWPNRAAARNVAIREALADGCTHLYLVDADTEVPHGQVEMAVARSVASGRVVYPFDDFRKVRRDRTTTILSMATRPGNWQQLAMEASRHLESPAGGALVVPASVLDVVGLYDERFTAWGCEDRCFLIAAETLTGPSLRLPGPAFHWWHPTAADKHVGRSREWEPLRALADRYRAAAGYEDFGWPEKGWPRTGPLSVPTSPPNVEAMRGVLSEPGGPLTPRCVV